MSQPSPASSTRRVITVESRARRGSDPTITTRTRKEVQRLPSGDSDVGKRCQKCGIKCQGFMPHLWRKKCITCGCDRDQHEKEIVSLKLIQSMEGVSLHQTLKAQEQSLKKKYAWYPKGISVDMVEQYMQCIPTECVPLLGSKGVEWRENQYMKQLPAYDTCPDACHDMADNPDKKRMTKFVDMRKKKTFGVGEVETLLECKICTHCNEVISPGSVVVIANRAGSGNVWHPQCFRCNTCNDLLVDMLYFYHLEDLKIYCGRHHGEKMVPRCAGCDELVFSSTYTESGGRKWHKEHLCCSKCDTNISGQKLREEYGDLLCETCFDKIAIKCQKCKDPIGIGSTKITHKGVSWHKECFVCKRCKEDLTTDRFFVTKGDLLCEECMEPIAQCHSCKQGIKASVSYLHHKNRTWHAECFKCVICQAWLADGEFNELDDNLICSKCFVNKVSKKCTTCNESVVGKAVQFGLSTYHPECFSCSECSRNLTADNVKVKEKLGKPICLDCHLKSAKKCCKCHNPIISKHTVYKSRPFHLECFTCNKCGVSVAKSEFFETSLNEILCMRCGN